MRRIFGIAFAMLLLVAGACGDGDGGGDGARFEPADGGEERTVLVDYRHDEFTSAFLRYYPEKVQVHPGDVVTFRQTWTGEPHSVTMGKVVDDALVAGARFEKYESEEEALAGGETPETIKAFLATFDKMPGMTEYHGYEIYQPGAQPCFVAEVADVPEWSNAETEEINPDAKCPEGGKEQPAFDGTNALYNSGFIAPEGDRANTFQLPIAPDAQPGTYRYYCNYHWTNMSGSVEIVAAGADIPSQQAVNRQAREEIEEDAELALQRVEEAREAAKGSGKVGDLALPLAGRDAEDEFTVIINEFLPKTVEAEVGEPVTWTFDGLDHTVSFNVPKYFPIFTVRDDGEVVWEAKSHEPVGWTVPERQPPAEGEEDSPPRHVDVGEWDGKGGFRSSGALSPGETFSVTFTKPGTYPFACVLHPQMVGTVEVD
jgi:plastocyanin